MAKKGEKKSFLMHVVAGGGAGATESLICHPLDTIKTRMQLSQSVGRPLSPFATASRIVAREGVRSLYKGLVPVVCGIIPKMSIRFSSFEFYKEIQADAAGNVSTSATFVAGLAAGVTEAVMVVTPVEVVKIRLQAQTSSMSDPSDWSRRKYKGMWHAAYCIVKEEGPSALYKGVIPTVLRQASNQAANFTAYQEIKKRMISYQGVEELQPWQHLMIGGFSGAMGPLCNSPLDVIKTRLQKQTIVKGQKPKYDGVTGAISTMFREEGIRAFYKGLSPRLMRIVPGQAITFMTYEAISKQLYEYPAFRVGVDVAAGELK
ncbi:hypothetical protein SARC_11721 [Sphaeroforma arctica JP610]|uniref:Succinate/fumarate mitochondrial transporter n=1 Tax=Sphaeroforma arctica JP610 TaxID=667725 RepID=A0A0L0FIA2_9EUKA|nr:hypothetical protein SARC_11721 [Sphaeroforma arctica JP610]KNC75763.1 hypothetical protein SARC_11721 [Sphaeroforma arctica JP610]|eukprot:XP_014149665.1 hypothetical protein SARC_11721 [Sphaeroforma arctica JP610]